MAHHSYLTSSPRYNSPGPHWPLPKRLIGIARTASAEPTTIFLRKVLETIDVERQILFIFPLLFVLLAEAQHSESMLLEQQHTLGWMMAFYVQWESRDLSPKWSLFLWIEFLALPFLLLNSMHTSATLCLNPNLPTGSGAHHSSPNHVTTTHKPCTCNHHISLVGGKKCPLRNGLFLILRMNNLLPKNVRDP